jgi:hypothetical protein
MPLVMLPRPNRSPHCLCNCRILRFAVSTATFLFLDALIVRISLRRPHGGEQRNFFFLSICTCVLYHLMKATCHFLVCSLSEECGAVQRL